MSIDEKETVSSMSDFSSIHVIHDYCSRLDSSRPHVVTDNEMMDEVIIPDIEAEEVFLETVIDESHLPMKLHVKKEKEEISDEEEEVEEDGVQDLEDETEDTKAAVISNSSTNALPHARINLTKLWTDANVKLLLDCRWECDHYFHNIISGRSKPWTAVLKKMREYNPDFSANDLEISNKFRNLTSTYRHNHRALQDTSRPAPISWPWYQTMHRILGSRVTRRPIKNYYSTMHKLAEEGRLSDALFPSDKSCSRFINGWTSEEVQVLIAVCEEFSDELQQSPRKVNLWKKVRTHMSQQSPAFTKSYTRVYSQWKYLVKEYRRIKRERKRRRHETGDRIPPRVPLWFYTLDTLVGSWQNLDDWDMDGSNDDENDITISDDDPDTSWDTTGVKDYKQKRSVSWDKDSSDKKANIWSKKDTELLIKLREDCEPMFQHPERTFMENWTHLKNRLCSYNPQIEFSAMQCAEKWRSLITTYHMVTRRKKSKEIFWEWWDMMHEALFKGNSSADNRQSKTEQPADTTCEPGDSNQDLTSPVFVIQEMEDGKVTAIAASPGGFQALRDQQAMPSSSDRDQPLSNNSRTLWSSKNIELLLKARAQISSGQVKSRTLWKNVRKRMLLMDPSFSGSAEQCWTKWRNLLQTYILNKQKQDTFGRHSVTWEWYDLMQNVMDRQDDPCLTDYETCEAVSQSEEDENTQENKLWTSKNIKLLLTAREEFKGLFTRPRCANKAWQGVRDRMVALDPSFQGLPTECSDKFRNLQGTYRANRRRHRLYGRNHVHWTWYDDMDMIMRGAKPDLAKLTGLSDFEDDTNQPFTDNELGGLGQSDIDELDLDPVDFNSHFWGLRNIRFLIEARKECQHYFAGTNKANAWERVREKICEKNAGFRASAAICSRKWRNLSFTYRAAKRRQLQGETPLWPWFKLFDRFYSSKKQDNVEELVLNEPMEETIVGKVRDVQIPDSNLRSTNWHEWLKEYLLRKEERDRRAEEREERLLALVEQLLFLERKKHRNFEAISNSTLFQESEEVTSRTDELSKNDNPGESVDSPYGNEILVSKSKVSQLLETRASIQEEVKNYSDVEFKNKFRVSRDIFKLLKHSVAYHEEKMNGGRPRLSKDLALLIVLWLLGNGNENYRSTSKRFGINESTCYRLHKLLVKKIAGLSTKYIKWPTGEELKNVEVGFSALKGDNNFPGVIGCVDSTHLSIKKQNSDTSYINANNHYSVILQAVSDHRGVFLDVCAGWPGSLHDSAVWRGSPMYQALENTEGTVPSDCHLLGDCAYPLSTYLMKPYPDDGNLTSKQHLYNATLTSTWEVIEGAFALLKARCTCLKKTIDSMDLDFIKDIILACCVLHNLCLLRDDDSKHDITMDTTVELDSGSNHYDCDEEPDIAADLKRSALAELIWRRSKLTNHKPLLDLPHV